MRYLRGISHECNYPFSVRRLPKISSSTINKNKTQIEIEDRLKENFESIRNLRFQQALQQLDNPALITKTRKEIAKIVEDPPENIKIFLFGHNLEKKSGIRYDLEKCKIISTIQYSCNIND